MEEMIKNALLSSAVYPLITGVVLGLVLSRLAADKDGNRDWQATLCVLAGFLVCFYTTVPFQFPPARVFSWIAYGAIGGGALLCLAAPWSPRVRLLAPLPVVAGLTYVFLGPVSRSWSTAGTVGIAALCAGFWLLLWWGHQTTALRTHAAATTLARVLAATGVSLVSVIGESAKSAQVAGGLAAACGALFLVSLFARRMHVGIGAAGVFMGVLGCLLFNAVFYIEIPWYVVGIAALGALGPMVLQLERVAAMTGVKKTVVVCLATLVPVIVALAVQQAVAPEADEYAY